MNRPNVPDEDLLCPHGYETATGHFDPAGYDPTDCAGCGLAKEAHVSRAGLPEGRILDLAKTLRNPRRSLVEQLLREATLEAVRAAPMHAAPQASATPAEDRREGRPDTDVTREDAKPGHAGACGAAPIRVMKIRVDAEGSTLYLPESNKDALWQYVVDWRGKIEIRFTEMTQAELDALPEFDGF